MEKRKHRSKAEWRNLIEQQARSGLNGVAFCERYGLSRKTFYRHRKVVEEKASDSLSGQFIKIEPKPAPKIPVQAAAVLHFGDSRLSLPADTEPAWVAELMKALP